MGDERPVVLDARLEANDHPWGGHAGLQLFTPRHDQRHRLARRTLYVWAQLHAGAVSRARQQDHSGRRRTREISGAEKMSVWFASKHLGG